MATIDLYPDSTQAPAVVLADLDLSAAAQKLLTTSKNTHGLLGSLTEAELFPDGFGVLARVLPKNFAIVWARECLKAVEGTDRPESASRCLRVVDNWQRSPDEAGRRQAMEVAEQAEYAHPEAWLAAAVGWSSGSLAPESQAEIRPPDRLTAVAVAASLSMIVSEKPERFAELSRQFIEQGLAMVAKPDSP